MNNEDKVRNMESLDLLNPSDLREHYRHQLKQTISAYNPTQIVLGEALQNAIDAIVEIDDRDSHEVNITLDLDQSAVTVADDGGGFKNDPGLLFLGGGTKRTGNRKLFGLVGVGIKVVLFSSKVFRLRAKPDEGAFHHEILDAYKFDNDPPPNLEIPRQFPDDSSPLNHGTEVHYQFPGSIADNPIGQFIQNMYDQCLPQGNDSGFGEILKSAVEKGVYPNRFAGLIAAFLLRYTYASDVLNCLDKKPELSNTTININVICSDPSQDFGDKIGDLFDRETQFSFTINPKYLLFSDTSTLAPRGTHIGSSTRQLGPGGTNLFPAANSFNTVFYNNPEEYKQLLVGQNEQLSREAKKSIHEYETKLFPKINGIVLTIARIPLFDKFLPGGSQRVISANGVVTTHSVDLTQGKNQQYVRCFDLVVDVDAKLNYGKSAITDRYLVKRIKKFLNDAYGATIQTAASKWVGRIPPDVDEQFDSFLSREDLNINQLAIRKVPKYENDVIALFSELLGRGYLEGYQNFGLSQMDPYDGRFIIRRTQDEGDPLPPSDERQLSVVEFKTEADKLFREFEIGDKNPRELNLVIAWEEGSSSSTQFFFENIEYSRHYPDKVYPGVTRYIEDTLSGVQIQVLLLKSITDNIREEGGND